MAPSVIASVTGIDRDSGERLGRGPEQWLGHTVVGRGNLVPAPRRNLTHANPALHGLPEIVA